jgi:hypothetical protein
VDVVAVDPSSLDLGEVVLPEVESGVYAPLLSDPGPEKLLVQLKAAYCDRSAQLSSRGWHARCYRAMRSKHIRAALVEYLDPRYPAAGQVPAIGLNEKGEVRIGGDVRDAEVYHVLSDDELPPYHRVRS